MSRRADPDRKPQLLAEIIDYLIDKPLSALTFRTLAEHLEVSTFTLVYHFGTKNELIAEVVEAICARQERAFLEAQISTATVDEFFDSFRTYWEWMLQPRNRQLQRLEFEAAMIESLNRSSTSATRKALERWHEVALNALLDLDVPADVARAEARAMTNVVFGFQFDLIVLGDVEQVGEAFERALRGARSRTRDMVAPRLHEVDVAP